MSYLVLQNQGTRWHPVDVLDDPEEVRRLGEGEFAIYSISDKNPPTLRRVDHRKQKSSIRSTEVK